MEKIVYIKSACKGYERIWKGTVEQMVHLWDRKINDNPKDVKSLVSALNKFAAINNCYDESYYVSDAAEYEIYAASGRVSSARYILEPRCAYSARRDSNKSWLVIYDTQTRKYLHKGSCRRCLRFKTPERAFKYLANIK